MRLRRATAHYNKINFGQKYKLRGGGEYDILI